MASTGNSTTTSQASNGTSQGGAPGGSFAPQGASPDELLVYWFDIALFGVLALFFLATIPRTFGRFSTISELAKGLTLRTGSSYAHRQQPPAQTEVQAQDKDNTRYPPYEFTGVGRDSSTSPPLHVPSLATVMHPISSFFSRSFTPAKSYGKLVLSLLYIVGILIIVFYEGDPLSDSERLGLIAVSQIPFVVVLGTKNNSIGMLLSMGYERLNYLHRLVGIVVFGTANFHALGYFYQFSSAGKLSTQLQVPYIAWGLAALIGIEILYFFSIPFLRQRCYPLFLASHIVGLSLFLIGVAMHRQEAVKYVIVGVVIYGIDHFLRVAKSRLTKARIHAIPELGVTRVELPTLTTGWRAGQHVRIRFLTMELGRAGWSTAHPFTIAGASDSASGKGLVLLCKKAGRWTNHLFAAAERADHYGMESGYGHYRLMSVLVEGPYGGLGNMVLSSYSSVLIVTGGSGVTLALSAAEEMVQMIQKGKSNTRFIEIVWTAQDMNSLKPLASEFSSILSACEGTGVSIKITVRYTRASAIPEGKMAYTLDSPASAALPQGLDVHPGRPNIKKMLDALVLSTATLKSPTGVAVCVCGPIELAAQVREVVRQVDGPSRSAVGGVELHEEVFGW